MNIVFLASEMAPFCKTGGLGDVIGALPKTLAKIGHAVEVFLPHYGQFISKELSLKEEKPDLRVQVSSYFRYGDIVSTNHSGVLVHFVVSPHFFDRDGLYYSPTKGNYTDNAERFIFFNKAVLEYLKGRGKPIDIIHCNDWQTGLVPAFLKTLYAYEKVFAKTKSVFTIHNLAYQGNFWHFDYRMTNLPQECFSQQGLEFWGDMSFLKAGIVYSDAVTTVSESYAKEIMTEEFGCGMEGVLKANAEKVHGIINGVDVEEWSPVTDPYIKQTYSARKPEGKADCKKDLQRHFNLPETDAPLFGFVGRLIDQKGMKLIAEIIEQLLGMPLQLAFLGSGEKEYELLLLDLAGKHPDRLGVRIGFDNGLAHRIEAGSDFFLMPSHFEPCGLNQMYSLLYGTLPIVRAVGGLNDTVIHYDQPGGNGFKFPNYRASELLQCIQEAVALHQNRKNLLALIKKGMLTDFSWENSAAKYLTLYKTLQE